MSSLVVLLPTHPPAANTEFDFAVTNDGATVAHHGIAAAQLLPSATRAAVEVVALVPASMISWHRVELPKGVSAAQQRLRAVLEGLLEDQLLDEPEALHFALQPQARTTGAQWVATCDRSWLRACVVALEQAGRPATRIVPEFAPEGDPALYAIGDPDQPMLVVAGAQGVTALPLSSQALGLLPSLPEDTAFIAEPAVAAAAEQIIQRQPLLRHPAERWLQASRSSWDLAQFEFSSSGRARAIKKLGTAWADLLAGPQWKPARWGAVLLLALNLVGLNAWAWRERSALDDKRVAIRTTLTSTFPQVKTVVDAPVQMEREVATLRQATGASSGSDLEAMLGVLSTAVPAQTTVAGVEFSNGELRAKGLAIAPADAANIVGTLKSQGYSAAMQGDIVVMSVGAKR